MFTADWLEQTYDKKRKSREPRNTTEFRK
jgi:hypothetical protein